MGLYLVAEDENGSLQEERWSWKKSSFEEVQPETVHIHNNLPLCECSHNNWRCFSFVFTAYHLRN